MRIQLNQSFYNIFRLPIELINYFPITFSLIYDMLILNY